jgi:hypothetical protein
MEEITWETSEDNKMDVTELGFGYEFESSG